MDETCRQFVLQLMQPMLREFNKTLSEMRDQGHTDAEIAAMLDRIELDSCGKMEKEILDAMMSELRLAAGIQTKPNLHARDGLCRLHLAISRALSKTLSELGHKQTSTRRFACPPFARVRTSRRARFVI